MEIKSLLLVETSKSPTVKFEKDWKFIEENNKNNLLILKKAPRLTAYFMSKGLILESEEINFRNKKHKAICFKVDSNYLISNEKC